MNRQNIAFSTTPTRTWRLAFAFTLFYLVSVITFHARISQWQRDRMRPHNALDDTFTAADDPARTHSLRRQILEHVPQAHSISSDLELSLSILASTSDKTKLDFHTELLVQAVRNPRSSADVRSAVPHMYKVLQNATAEQRAALIKVLEEIARHLPKGATTMRGPKLVVSKNEPTFHDTLVNLLAIVGPSSAVVVVDDYNFDTLQDSVFLRDGRVPVIHILTNIPKEAAKLAENKAFQERPTVICMGGGAVLDVCKAAAITGKDLVLLPTLMSTACVSNNRSVLGLGTRSFQTSIPSRIVFNIDALVTDKRGVVKQWTRAGVVEFLVSLAGGIDQQYQQLHSCHKNEGMNLQTILETVPSAKHVYDSLSWFDTSFTGEFDHNEMLRIMKYVHETGSNVVGTGVNGRRIGGEHSFYRALMRINPALRNSITHGEVVSLGVLLSLKIYSMQWGDDSLYLTFRRIFAKMDMPLTYRRFEVQGLTRDWMLQALAEIKRSEGTGQYILVDCIASDNVGLVLDEIFAES